MTSMSPPTLVLGINSRPVGYLGSDTDTHCVSDKTFTSLEGFVGRDPVRSEIVLAIRGSESIRNWIADLTLSKTSVSTSFHGPRCAAKGYLAWFPCISFLPLRLRQTTCYIHMI